MSLGTRLAIEKIGEMFDKTFKAMDPTGSSRTRVLGVIGRDSRLIRVSGAQRIQRGSDLVPGS